MLPFIAMLLAQGLHLAANVALTKGADYVKEKTGVDITQGQLNSEDLTKIKQWELENERELMQMRREDNRLDAELVKVGIGLIQSEDIAVTDRWKADTSTDSWLAKNVRPITLLYILGAYTVLALLAALFKLNVPETYLALLSTWGGMVLTAYFGGRSLEKIVATIKGSKNVNGS
jgi:hypothetical protein